MFFHNSRLFKKPDEMARRFARRGGPYLPGSVSSTPGGKVREITGLLPKYQRIAPKRQQASTAKAQVMTSNRIFSLRSR
jgi:hypothetical protein